MTILVRSTGNATATAATSLSIPLGGTPSRGDLVVVALACSNQIVTHPPGYNSTNQWFKLEGLCTPFTRFTYSLYYHTWNAADSGSSATFTFSKAPTLGVGDLDLSSTDAAAIATVVYSNQVNGGCAVSAHTIQGSNEPVASLTSSTVNTNNNVVLLSAFGSGLGADTITLSDGAALGINSVALAADGLVIKAWANSTNGIAPYRATISESSGVAADLVAHALTVTESTTNWTYNPPIIYEGPVAEDPLFYRYTLKRYYTVLNNGGVFTAHRYSSTDQLNAATQVFTNNSPVVVADRANILAAGVGGDFTI